MEGKERLNVETSEGLNVEKQKRTEPCRKKKGGGDGMRPFPAGPQPVRGKPEASRQGRAGSIGVPFEAQGM